MDTGALPARKISPSREGLFPDTSTIPISVSSAVSVLIKIPLPKLSDVFPATRLFRRVTLPPVTLSPPPAPAWFPETMTSSSSSLPPTTRKPPPSLVELPPDITASLITSVPSKTPKTHPPGIISPSRKIACPSASIVICAPYPSMTILPSGEKLPPLPKDPWLSLAQSDFISMVASPAARAASHADAISAYAVVPSRVMTKAAASSSDTLSAGSNSSGFSFPDTSI